MTKKLDTLMAEGLTVYPPGVGGLAYRPRFLSTSQRTIAGVGQPENGSRFGAGIPTSQRPAAINGRRRGRTIVLAARQTAWGAGRSKRAPTKAERQRNRQRFITWLRKNEPKLYALAKQRAGTPPAGLGQTTAEEQSDSWFSKFTDALQNLAPTYLQYQQQKDLMELQLERARAGQPPLETEAYAAPAIVRVQADPETVRTAVTTGAEQIIKSPVAWALAGGLLLLAFAR